MIFILLTMVACCVISTVIIVTYIYQSTKLIINTIFKNSEIITDTQIKTTKKLLGIKEHNDERD